MCGERKKERDVWRERCVESERERCVERYRRGVKIEGEMCGYRFVRS